MCNNRLTKEIIETRYKLKIKNQEDLKAAIKHSRKRLGDARRQKIKLEKKLANDDSTLPLLVA